MVAAVLLALASCGSEEDETQVAVRNGGSASIDVTIGDGSDELAFTGVAPGTTSSFKTASFGSLSGLTVTVGTQQSDVDLTEGRRNVVDVGADGKVTGVVAQQGGSSEGGGW